MANNILKGLAGQGFSTKGIAGDLSAAVTKSISSAGLNIDEARVNTTQDQKAVSCFDVWVKDVRTLNTVMKEIERIKGVLSVERVKV